MPEAGRTVSLWQRIEFEFQSSDAYDNPPQEVEVAAEFIAPSGAVHRVDAFWDGGRDWKLRFMPTEQGEWSFSISSSTTADSGLHGQGGSFTCIAPTSDGTKFDTHGPIVVSDDARHLAHADGTPFLWIADTQWCSGLGARPAELTEILDVRREQGFNTIQFVATQWRMQPDGDREGQLAYSGRDRIEINPEFFRALDSQVDLINRSGFLAAPVMLWANPGRDYKDSNPGWALPDDQAALLARYMLARWGAHHVVWLLDGDELFRQPGRVDKWRRIGDAVFNGRSHGPVAIHPQGEYMPKADFDDKPWASIIGYQSGHRGNESSFSWLHSGPPSTDWNTGTPRVIMNLEPCYEAHMHTGGFSHFTADEVRVITWWSMFASPPAGVTYGGNGVWGFDQGGTFPFDHPNTGIAPHWREGLRHAFANKQIRHIGMFFESTNWTELIPAPDLIAEQPAPNIATGKIVALANEARSVVAAFTPRLQSVTLRLPSDGIKVRWFDTRTGEWSPARGKPVEGGVQFDPPGVGDWALLATR